MKKRLFPMLALGLLSMTGFAMTAAATGDDEPKLEATKSGKDLFCRVKVKIHNNVDQTIQVDKLRISSSTEPGFYSEFDLNGSRYRPVSGATIATPTIDVMVPAGHKVSSEITYRKQITAGKDPKFSGPKTDKWGAGAIQPACSLAGQDLLLTVHE